MDRTVPCIEALDYSVTSAESNDAQGHACRALSSAYDAASGLYKYPEGDFGTDAKEEEGKRRKEEMVAGYLKYGLIF